MEILRFGLVGLASGAIYAVLAQGLVLVYKGSGLLNFAQGAIAMVGAYMYRELTVEVGAPPVVGLIGALVLCATLGATIHLVLLGPMRRSSPLSRVFVTLGLLVSLQSAAYIIYGPYPLSLPSLLPIRSVNVFSSQLPLGEDRIIIIAIGIALTATLYAFYRWSAFGRVTTCVAENQLVAASLGHSPDIVAAVNWAIASALAGLAGVLIAPIILLEPTALVLLVLPAMAAALPGQFSSFALTLAMAFAIGIGQSEITRYVSAPGWATAATFIVVIVVLVARGQSLPLRSFVSDRLPAVSSGRIHPIPTVLLLVLAGAAIALANPTWAVALTTTFAIAIICLSVIVVTGYAGQLSLAQYVLAGVGAFIAAKFAAHMSFPVAVVLGAAATGLVGGIVGIPALRTRGITLAIVTLGLGASLADVVLGNPRYTGDVAGIAVPIPHLFGWDIDPFEHANRYAAVVLVVLAVLSLGVMNLRRGAVGRRMLAVRSNERAASSLGVNVAATKSYAFMLAAAIAALGGILLAFMQPSVIVANFDVFSSILLVAVVVAGGVGAVGGALLGALLLPGGVVSQLFVGSATVNNYLPLLGGVGLLIILRIDPDGEVHAIGNTVAWLSPRVAPTWERVNARFPGKVTTAEKVRRSTTPARTPGDTPERVPARALSVANVSVSYGGVHAVREVSLEVRPGEVHGLIGPNGAGKTSLIDAITGFAEPTAGTVSVGEVDITGLSPRRRAREGLARSFQSLELFEDLTVLENVAVADEQPGRFRYIADLVKPGRIQLTSTARDSLSDLGLEDLADRRPDQLSFGRRKEAAIARAIAGAPSVLLLDEPAAGLDDSEAAELAGLIRRLAHDRGIAVLLVEHKIDMIMSISDRVSVLAGGAILTSGTPAEVRADPAVLDAYLGTSSTDPASRIENVAAPAAPVTALTASESVPPRSDPR